MIVQEGVEPIVTIFRLQERTVNDFAKIHCTGPSAVSPVWCNGIILALYSFNDNSETIIQRRLDGHIDYEEISWASMEKYRPRLKIGENEFETPVVDLSGDKLMQEIVAYIKKVNNIE